MSTAAVQLNLVSGSTQQRLRAMALDSANVKASWEGLPANLQRAHRELLNLGTQQQRLGYLRHEERQSFRLHAEYVRRHQDAVQAHMQRLKSTIDSSPHLARYESLRASGGLDAAIASDPHMEQLHRAHRQVDDMRRQSAIMAESRQVFDRWGMHGDFDPAAGASYWVRRGMLGTRDGQTPRTLGQWGADAARGAYEKASSTVRQVAGIFGAFSVGSFLHSSIKEFDNRTQEVQRVGAKLGGTFDDVGRSLDRLRKETAYTRREILPAMEAIGRVTGNAGLAEGGLLDYALKFGRATGIGPAAAQQFAQMAMYGTASPQLAWGMMNGVGMRDRPEAFLGMMAAAQAAMGQGVMSVRDGDAAKWAGYAADIGGESFKNERGAALIQRLIGGSKAMPNAYVQAAKYGAIVGTGKYDLGNGVIADSNNMFDLQMIADSGLPDVYEREVSSTLARYGGAKSDAARFQLMHEFGLSAMDANMIAQGKRKGVKFRNPKKEWEKAPSMPEAAEAATTETDKINASMEATYEAAGKELLPTVHDFKRAIEEFGKGIAGQQGAIDAFKGAMAHLTADAEGGALTRSVATILAASMAESGLGKVLSVGTLWGAGTAGAWDDESYLRSALPAVFGAPVQAPTQVHRR